MIPLFGGYDQREGEGRIFSADIAGHVTEDLDYESVGSGSQFAKAR